MTVKSSNFISYPLSIRLIVNQIKRAIMRQRQMTATISESDIARYKTTATTKRKLRIEKSRKNKVIILISSIDPLVSA